MRFVFQARDQLRCSIGRQSVANSVTDFLEHLLPLEIKDTSTETRDLARQTHERTKRAQELNEFICSRKVSDIWTAESSNVITEDIVLYKQNKIRLNNLEKLFKALITIQPTS